MTDRMRAAGIPKRFWECSLESYQGDEDGPRSVRKWAVEFVETVDTSPQGAILVGKTGTGKTHVVCGILRATMERLPAFFSEFATAYQERVLYTTVSRMVQDIRDSWQNRSEKDARQKFKAPRLLVVDEIGAQSGTDFERNTLFDIIDARYGAEKPTILVSNLPMDQVETLVGERVIDRMREDGGKVFIFDWDSHR